MPGLGTKEGTAFRQDLLINRPIAEPSLEGFFFFALDDNSGTLYQCDGEEWVTITGGLRRLVSGSGITLVNTPTTITINNTYSLPIATSSILGGIKVGLGLAIDSGGVLSATGSTLPSDIAYTDVANIFTVHQQIDTHVAGSTGDLTLSILDHTTSSSIYVTALGTGNFLEYHSPASVFIIDNSSNIYMGGTFKQINNTGLLDGQLLIGNTAGGRMDVATLTAGTGITITNAAGSITVAANKGDFVKLAEVIVGVTPQGTVDFPAIDQGYRTLRLDFSGICDGSSNSETFMQVNGDTSAHYNSEIEYSFGINHASHGVGNGTSAEIGLMTDNTTAPATACHAISLTFPNYTGTILRKTWTGTFWSMFSDTTTGHYTGTAGGDWHSTAALTRITIFTTVGNWVQGTVATLYGLK